MEVAIMVAFRGGEGVVTTYLLCLVDVLHFFLDSHKVLREDANEVPVVCGNGAALLDADELRREGRAKDHIGVQHNHVLRSDVRIVIEPIDDGRRLIVCRIAVTRESTSILRKAVQWWR
jgi:RNase P/RNase MRP subunit p30